MSNSTLSIKVVYESTTKRVQLCNSFEDQLICILSAFNIPNDVINSLTLYYEYQSNLFYVNNNQDFNKAKQICNTNQQKTLKLFLTNQNFININNIKEIGQTESNQSKQFSENEDYLRSKLIEEEDKKLNNFIDSQLSILKKDLISQIKQTDVYKSRIEESINNSIYESKISQTSFLNSKNNFIKFNCSYCLKEKQNPYAFYCSNEVCDNLVFCNDCETQHFTDREESHKPIKSYKLYTKNTLDPALKDLLQDAKLNFDKDINQSYISNLNSEETLNSEFLSELSNVIVKKGKKITKIVKIKNNGSKSWPKDCELECLNVFSQILGKGSKIGIKINPEQEVNVEINLFSDSLEQGDYESYWQVKHEKDKFFGQIAVIKIKIV